MFTQFTLIEYCPTLPPLSKNAIILRTIGFRMLAFIFLSLATCCFIRGRRLRQEAENAFISGATGKERKQAILEYRRELRKADPEKRKELIQHQNDYYNLHNDSRNSKILAYFLLVISLVITVLDLIFISQII